MTPIEMELIDELAKFEHDPRKFALFTYPWGEGELSGEALRAWQIDILSEIRDHLKNKETRFQPLRIAVTSGHGTGKTCLISIICNWAMSTKEDTKIIITANTDTQLKTKTGPELSKWFRLAINSHWFKLNATSIHSVDSEHERSWRLDMIPWSENNTEAFAGAHNKGKRIVIIFDEASAISDKIWEVTEGALTDENTEIIWIAFGNPTRNTGRFRECFRKFKGMWKTWCIDSRDVEGTNKTLFKEWAENYGEESDFFKIRVRGMFPSSSLKQFISTDDVDKAYGKHLTENQFSFAPKILTVDPAWEGDDETVIALRQGLAFKILASFPKNDNDVNVATAIARFEDQEQADAVFIDAGYGTGIVSVGRTLGRSWQLVWFAEKPIDPGYVNKRAEMWGLARDWLKQGGAIPKDQSLYHDLIGPETVARLDGKVQLESKKDMKARGIPSPNRGDALALSFAYPVASKLLHNSGHTKMKSEYDPLADN